VIGEASKNVLMCTCTFRLKTVEQFFVLPCFCSRDPVSSSHRFDRARVEPVSIFNTRPVCVCVGVCVRFDSSLWFQVCKTNQLQQKLEDDTYSLDVPIVQKKQRNAERYNSLRKNPPEPKVSVRFWLARMIEERIYIPGFVQIPFIPIFPISPIPFLSIDPFNFHLCLA